MKLAGIGSGLGPNDVPIGEAGSDTKSQSEITDGDAGNIGGGYVLLFAYHMGPHKTYKENHRGSDPWLGEVVEEDCTQGAEGPATVECDLQWQSATESTQPVSKSGPRAVHDPLGTMEGRDEKKVVTQQFEMDIVVE